MLLVKIIYWMTMAILFGLPVGVATVIFLSKQKGNKCGINLSEIECSKCGNAVPAVRMP